MNTKLLKQKILDLAIRGKLVPQDPNDEPASELHKRIRAEKEKLIAEGKIKRSKKTGDKPHYENMPFEIPSNWEWVRIGDVFSMQAGKNISAIDISSEKVGNSIYPCYGGNGLRGYVKTFNNDGAFPIIGRQGALCGNVNIVEGKFYATEHAVVTNCYNVSDVHWAFYFLIALNLNQYATATAQPGLAVSNILSVLMPLPPYCEQIRIVSAIEHMFALIDSIENEGQRLQKAINLAKSKILDLAIHGKLVSQDPNDEPASELLKRIAPYRIPCDTSHYGN
ncbi:MAG: restriction endonuclease subunit S, partial [Bacteroidales bacterium]|nr:restriction endonuclease subunit S [Bacteroidales bacterium]